PSDRKGAARKDAALEPAERRGVAPQQVLPCEKQGPRASASRLPRAVRCCKVVRLLVDVHQVRPKVAQGASQARPGEQVVAAVKPHRLYAQTVFGRRLRLLLELDAPTARFAPLRSRDCDQLLDIGMGSDRLEL